jgi:hypothetical protein
MGRGCSSACKGDGEPIALIAELGATPALVDSARLPPKSTYVGSANER